ncbi:MAG: glycosyltransferase [Nitrospirae bacterium]|nr:glycosyltransferase [Nitrospirota bacterium]
MFKNKNEFSIKRKINVLHVIERLPLDGGAENLLLVLAKNIDRSKFNLIFCCFIDGGYVAERLVDEGFKVVCLGNHRKRYFYKKIIELVRLMKADKIDIVHTHLILANMWGAVGAYMSKVPVICKTEHGIMTDLRTNCNRILDKFYSRIIYVSKSQREIFKGETYDPLKHVVIYNAFNEDHFAINKPRENIRSLYGFSNDDIVVGIVGRLVLQKGHDYLFIACKEIKNIYRGIKMLIVGSGSEEIRLKELARVFGLDALFLSGRNDIPELMRSMDIYVQPSLEEPFGIAIVEAMYSGLPVIATGVGGIPEIIKDGETGILVPPQDSKALANALLSLIENPGLARTMGERGREVAASRFSGRRYAMDMERLYSSLVEGRRR